MNSVVNYAQFFDVYISRLHYFREDKKPAGFRYSRSFGDCSTINQCRQQYIRTSWHKVVHFLRMHSPFPWLSMMTKWVGMRQVDETKSIQWQFDASENTHCVVYRITIIQSKVSVRFSPDLLVKVECTVAIVLSLHGVKPIINIYSVFVFNNKRLVTQLMHPMIKDWKFNF